MISVIGHDNILTNIQNQHLRNRVHHSWFFQGEPGVGKLETSLWFAQGYYCENREFFLKNSSHSYQIACGSSHSYQIACGQCRSCKDIEFYRHKQILLLTVGDRLPVIAFFQKILLSKQSQSPEKVIYHLAREINQLLARHRQQLLDFCIKEKTTYREGIKLTSEELEKLIHRIYIQYQEVLHFSEDSFSGKIPYCLTKKEFLDDMRKLQNCLDRSVLTKNNLDKVINWCKHNADGNKLVIIENIELINNNIVGLFLKILEDPPPNVFFILITEDMDSLNQEITLPLLSRCLNFSFPPLTKMIDEILRKKFQIETGFINQESNFQFFFQKNLSQTTISVLGFLLQPIYKILEKIQDKNFNEEKIVNGLYDILEKYAQKRENSFSNDLTIKISYRQALSIIHFLNQNYFLVKKNNYSKTNFIIELSFCIKKNLKIHPVTP